MKPIKIFTYSGDLALLKKYLEAIIQSLELKIFYEKVLFDFYIILERARFKIKK